MLMKSNDEKLLSCDFIESCSYLDIFAEWVIIFSQKWWYFNEKSTDTSYVTEYLGHV